MTLSKQVKLNNYFLNNSFKKFITERNIGKSKFIFCGKFNIKLRFFFPLKENTFSYFRVENSFIFIYYWTMCM